MILTYDISALIPYINWPYYYFAWQVKEPAEKKRLRTEAEAFLRQQEGSVNSKAVRPISVWQILFVPFHQVSKIKLDCLPPL